MSEVAPPSAGPSAPASAGALLREARERQGVHIAVLAAAIKVSPRKLDALEADNEYLQAGGVFPADLIETWIDYKRTNEVDPIRLRPHPHEFELYYDI